jgi:hypothetical protein
MGSMRSPVFKSRLSKFGRSWLHGRRRPSGKSPLKQARGKTRLGELPLRSSSSLSQPFLIDFLEVNGELPYTTVVEGLEEFLYQSELQPHMEG